MTILLVILGIIVAILIRIPYVFLPYIISHGGDGATMGLMAKDISSGRFFTFFYGQAYMGPLETYITAPLVRVFGSSNITFFIGAMIIFSIFLFVTYLLASEFKGQKAGLFAVCYCIVLPYYLYFHTVLFLGYFITILILGNIIFLMTLKIVKNPDCIIYYIIYGLAAGLGFWNHYSISYFIISSVIFLLLNVRFFSLVKRGVIAILPFVAGSLPYWVYNLKYNFRSLNMYDGHPNVWRPVNVPWWQILNRYISFHIFGAFGISLDNIIGWILLALYVICLINLLSRKNGKNRLLFVFFIITTLFIVTKNKYFIWLVHDYRYAIVMLSLIPLAVAVMADRLFVRNKYLGVSFIFVFMVINGQQVVREFKEHKTVMISDYKNYNDLINFFSDNEITGFVGPFPLVQDINFITEKKIVGAELFNGRAPTDLDLDTRDNIALVNCAWIIGEDDIERLCLKWKQIGLNGLSILYDFAPYPYYGSVMNRSFWKISSNASANPTKYAIDGNLDRFWISDIDKQIDGYFKIDFGEIYKIYKFEILNYLYYNMPHGYKVEVSIDNKNWTEVSRCDGHPRYIYWSGPRIYWDILVYRWEEIFHPVDARFLRITQFKSGADPWMINEIYVYKYEGEKKLKFNNYIQNAKELYSFLSSRDIKFVYTDYWLSGKIKNWSKGTIGTLNRSNECWPGRKNTSHLMKLDQDSAIVITKENEEIVDSVLSALKITLKKEIIDGYVCYLFSDMNKWERYFVEKQKCLFWTGLGIAIINSHDASRLFQYYANNLPESQLDRKIEYLRQAVKLFPKNIAVRSELSKYRNKEKLIINKKFTPEVKTDVEFSNGIKLKGYSFRHFGKKCQLSYFWELSDEITENIIVFTLLKKDEKILFHNDHGLLEYKKGLKTFLGELLVERFWFDLPSFGKYEIIIGLYLPDKDGKRVKIKGTGLNKASRITIGEVIISPKS